MEEDNRPLLQPLKTSSTTTTTNVAATPFPVAAGSAILPADKLDSNIRIIPSSSSSSSNSFGIIFRLALIFSIGILSMWANHEASKGFSISIVNEARDTSPGKRFDLLYVSNDEASRLVITTSKFVENFLYPNSSYPKKQVSHVTLRMSGRNLSQPIIVDSGEDHDQFVIHISPSIMREVDFKHAMFRAMQHGMVRLWLWDGSGNAPTNLVNGIVEYVSESAISNGTPEFGCFGLGSLEMDGHCWKSKNAKAVARFLNYCELKRPGFIRRLNRGMRNDWHDRMVDDAFGMHLQRLCDAHNSSRNYQSSL